MSGTENNQTGTLDERLRLGAGFAAADCPRTTSYVVLRTTSRVGLGRVIMAWVHLLLRRG
jgi:hypothetical protein